MTYKPIDAVFVQFAEKIKAAAQPQMVNGDAPVDNDAAGFRAESKAELAEDPFEPEAGLAADFEADFACFLGAIRTDFQDVSGALAVDCVYAGGPLVVERIAPDIEGFRAESLGDDWEPDGYDARSDFACWYGYQDGECVFSGPFVALMPLIETYQIDQIRSPLGEVYRRSQRPNLMASIRDIARGG